MKMKPQPLQTSLLGLPGVCLFHNMPILHLNVPTYTAHMKHHLKQSSASQQAPIKPPSSRTRVSANHPSLSSACVSKNKTELRLRGVGVGRPPQAVFNVDAQEASQQGPQVSMSSQEGQKHSAGTLNHNDHIEETELEAADEMQDDQRKGKTGSTRRPNFDGIVAAGLWMTKLRLQEMQFTCNKNKHTCIQQHALL
jgi:hypothetical protein